MHFVLHVFVCFVRFNYLFLFEMRLQYEVVDGGNTVQMTVKNPQDVEVDFVVDFLPVTTGTRPMNFWVPARPCHLTIPPGYVFFLIFYIFQLFF